MYREDYKEEDYIILVDYYYLNNAKEYGVVRESVFCIDIDGYCDGGKIYSTRAIFLQVVYILVSAGCVVALCLIRSREKLLETYKNIVNKQWGENAVTVKVVAFLIGVCLRYLVWL